MDGVTWGALSSSSSSTCQRRLAARVELSQSARHCPELCPALGTPLEVQQHTRHTMMGALAAGGNPEAASSPFGLDGEVVREGFLEKATSELRNEG